MTRILRRRQVPATSSGSGTAMELRGVLSPEEELGPRHRGTNVLQGSWIAENNDTGSSEPAHLHFDVHTYGQKGIESAPGLGTQLLIHFEDKTRHSFRPVDSEFLSGKSNNVEGAYRQDSWRQSGRVRALYFTPNPGSACPEGDEHQYRRRHLHAARCWRRRSARAEGLEVLQQVPCGCSSPRVSTRTVPRDLARRTPPGAIPTHWSTMSPIRPDTRADGATARTARCCGSTRRVPRAATNGAHSSSGSGNYRLHHTADDWQRNWRLCSKCAGLFFGPKIAQSRCIGSPQGQGPHVVHGAPDYTHNYFLSLESPDAPGQGGWRYCHKCQGLWMGLNANSACPATGEHSAGKRRGPGHRKRLTPTARARKAGGGAQSVRGSTTGMIDQAVTHKCPGGGDHKTSGSEYRACSTDGA